MPNNANGIADRGSMFGVFHSAIRFFAHMTGVRKTAEL
jgi:hypothetical protein